MSAGPEAQLVTKIRKAILARWPEAYIVKYHGSAFSQAGVPDLLVIIDGAAVMLEVKAAKPMESANSVMSRVTPLQMENLAKIRKAGGVADVVWDCDQALDVLNSLLPRKERSDSSKDVRLYALARDENNLRKSVEHLEGELQELRVAYDRLRKVTPSAGE